MTDSNPSIDRFDASVGIESARVPPAAWYVDMAYHQRDLSQVIHGQWQVVAHRDQLPRSGSYRAGCTSAQPWVVVRDEAGELRAFANVCRHNGTPVAEGAGDIDQFVCRYHGWTYDLSGRLTKAPRMAGIAGFDRADFALVPLPVKTFGPLILINLAGDASAWEVTEVEAQLNALNWNDLQLRQQRVYEVDCNWKVFVDNYLDGGYHVSSLHPDLASGLDMASYNTQVYALSASQTVDSLADAKRRVAGAAVYAWVFPNLMINRYGPMMDINRVTPLGPNRCRVDFDWYFAADCSPEFMAESIVASDQVQQEDIAVCEALQQGIGSAHFRPGPYAPRVELAKFHFHRLLAAQYASAH